MSARRPKSAGSIFVVHKHQARQLHYDFRLELHGVLKSWALAKGPSLDPHSKRLAIEVEDHPLDYAEFEGIIPEGYGAGTVMLWDQGTWSTGGDAAADLRQGKLEFFLHGRKLKGGFVLVRMRGKASKQWLLIKRADRWARSSDEGEVIDQRPLSVLTRRDLRQIASDRDRVWSGCGGG
jgi:bifunctional non-homologous end joining protein LigD